MMSMTTTTLVEMMYSGDIEALEAAIEISGYVKVTRKMADRISMVAEHAFETDKSALETICQLSSYGAARQVRLVLAKAARMGF